MPSDRAAHFAALSDDLQAFRHYIQAERGLAANTLLAYGRDLDRFAGWVAGAGLGDYLRPTLRDLTHYLEFLRAENLAPPSVARHLVSLKVFYRFLRLEERTNESTVELLSSPSLWERIPQVLSPESIVKLLEAPQPLDRFFLRDRAILETMYATGGRASEVVKLRLEDTYLDSGFCKCFGKGSKQRIVPLGRMAVNALRAYLEGLRPRLTLHAPDAPWVFVSRGGRATDARHALGAGQEVRAPGRPQRQGQPAHAAPQLRHAPAGRRRRPAHGAGAARPRQHPHHAAVHPRGPRPAPRHPREVPPARREAGRPAVGTGGP